MNGAVKEFYQSGLIKIEYTVVNGMKDGTQRVYYPNGSLKEISIFDNGSRVQISRFDPDPNFTPLPEAYLAGNRQQELFKSKKQDIICDADICPWPVGGMKTIEDNLIYPAHALLYGLEGNVIVVTTVDEKGDVTQTDVIKHLGLGCDEAAQEAIKKTKFIPGQKDGKLITASVTLNIDFKIVDRSVIAANPDTIKVDRQESPVSQREFALNETKIDSAEITEDEQKSLIKLASGTRQIAEVRCEDADVCPYPAAGILSIEKNLEKPFISKRLKLHGEIIIEAWIDKFGLVRDTKVLQGIGYGCDEAVESALMRTKFTPAKKAGKDVDSKVIVYFPFKSEE